MIPSSPLHTKPLTAALVCIILLLLLGLVRCQTAQAMDEGGAYIIIGIGGRGCAHVSIPHDDGGARLLSLIGWLGGYMTAMHYELQETLDWILQYCHRNQDHSIAQAAAAYVKAAYPTRQQHAPPVDLPAAPRSPALKPAFPALPQWEQPQPTKPVKRQKR
jgi:hypothetical protein